MNKYKVAMVGSHGTGKSSAAGHLGATLKRNNPKLSIKVIEENIREIALLFSNKLNSPDFQKLCMIDHLHKEMMAERVYNAIVCDRSALDTLVYGMIYKIQLPAEYFSLAINHLNTFKQVYFVRPNDYNDLLADDGFRDTNKEIRKQVDLEFERMLKLWGGNYKEIKTSDIFTYDYLKDLNGSD